MFENEMMMPQQFEFSMFGLPVQVQNFGDEFLLLRAAGTDNLNFSRLARSLFERQFDFVAEVIATEVEICLKLTCRFDSQCLVQLQQLESWPDNAVKSERCATKSEHSAAKLEHSAVKSEYSAVLQLPVCFSEADDWEAVCNSTGLDRSTYLQRLLECQFQVAMLGFLPGFVYLNGLPDSLQVARKANPDRQTEVNSFAVGGRYAGIYSLPSPAGWNVLGRLAVSLLQTDQLPPVALQPGDQLTLESVNQADYHQLLRTGATLEQFNG
ncbi:MAG: carboxyltransferase domain-containing protein [Fuerstiella sp.]